VTDRAREVIAGKYRLAQSLGVGGMAEVWSATNRFTERQVAIKLLAREIAGAPDATQRFLNEAKVSARVDHPNIVEILDVGQAEDGQLFLVMELLTGHTLETALRRQRPPLTSHELALVMTDIAAALDAAHAAGIVHRDLKPSNIFLHKTKNSVRPKLLDFGVSKFRGKREGDTEEEQSITIAGTVLGSPLYMSPEQARGETEVDGRSDIFAFGGILFEALTGFRAYDAKNFNALIVKIATSRPKSIDDHIPNAPESIRRVVRACLEPDLARRAASFREVLVLLRAALPDLAAAPRPLPAALVPAALFDPDATNALPVFTPSTPIVLSEATVYEAALEPREAPRPSPWLPVAGGAVIIAGMAIYSMRSVPAPPATATTARPPPIVVRKSELTVVASPGTCVVSIDGSERGPSPVTAKLASGEHTVTCRPSSGPVRTGNVTVGPDAPARYRFLLD